MVGHHCDSREQEKEMSEKNLARFLRIATIRNVLGSNLIDREDALELLKGCLTPGDESTRQDDSYMLDWTVEQVEQELGFGAKNDFRL